MPVCGLFTASGLGTLPKPLVVTVHPLRVFGSSASTRSVDDWLCLSLAGKSGIAPPFHYRGLQPNILSSPRYWRVILAISSTSAATGACVRL